MRIDIVLTEEDGSKFTEISAPDIEQDTYSFIETLVRNDVPIWVQDEAMVPITKYLHPGQAPKPKEAPSTWTPEYINSTSRARRFLAWAAVIEYGDVNPTFHPEDPFGDVICNGARVWEMESAIRLDACMEAANKQFVEAYGPDGIFDCLHEIYQACGYEDANGEATN